MLVTKIPVILPIQAPEEYTILSYMVQMAIRLTLNVHKNEIKNPLTAAPM